MLSSLNVRISEILNQGNTVAIFPIRELIPVSPEDKPAKLECYFPLSENQIPPIIQPPFSALGSEAFISNLITQLCRRFKNQIVGGGKPEEFPSIDVLRASKVDTLIFIDDLIGSGKRTIDFMNSVYKNPTIKSWLSGKHISFHIVSYMGTPKGEKAVRRWCKNHKDSVLDVLHSCPMLDLKDQRIVDVCNGYSDIREPFPLGFKNSAVRVVFSYSAPNNLPAILFRNKKKLKTRDISLRGEIVSWNALFPGRSIDQSLNTEMTTNKKPLILRQQIKEILYIVGLNSGINKLDISNQFSGEDSQLHLILGRCVKFNWLEITNLEYKITRSGTHELSYLNRNKTPKGLANNAANYYPSK